MNVLDFKYGFNIAAGGDKNWMILHVSSFFDFRKK